MAYWNAIGSIVGGAISGGGAMSANHASAKAAKVSYQHRYQWSMEDARKAGLNPMLVAGATPPVPSQPHFENVGEAAVKGASAGAGAVTAAKVAKAQVTNLGSDTALKTSSAKAQDAMANKTALEAEKTRIEIDNLNKYGSARQQAEIDKIRQDISESITRAAETSMRLDLGMQEFMHREKHNPIVRELDSALAQAKRAEIPLKDLIATVAGSIAGSLKKLSEIDGKALLRDTANLIEDKLGNAGKSLWDTATAPYRFIDGKWQALKEYASETRQEAVR